MTEKKNILKRQFHLPFLKPFENVISTFSLTGKVILYTLTTLFVVSSLMLLWNVNNEFLVEVPQAGGVLKEGVIGLPRFINPVLAVTEGDKDLVALVYSGLLRIQSDGTFIPDLAQNYTISPDGRIYTFTLRQGATFQDGTPVTADDVVFTIQKIQDPALKSSKKANWDGVTVEKVDEYTVRFILTQAYAPFLENTTVGILPSHLWQGFDTDSFMTSELNLAPIGSGPYKLTSIARNDNGVPLSAELSRFTSFTLGAPLIKNVVITFYTTEKNLVSAYEDGDIQSLNSISPDNALMLKQKGASLIQASLPRTFALFLNQKNNVALAQKEVRNALNISVDRDYIVNTTLQGFASPLDSAVPKSFTSSTKSLSSSDWQHSQTDEAIHILDQNGWKPNEDGIREKKIGKDVVPLSFSISTTDAPELKEVAEILKIEWRKIGADVTIKVIEGGNLNQDIIKPRKYDALLFGQVVNRDLDLYAFWHSSQQADPGLNVALYSNKTVDTLLEKMRATTDRETRISEYNQFEDELNKDIPAIFLYSPNFIYIVPPELKNIALEQITTASDRFTSIYTWYLTTEKIWKIFIKH